MRVVNNPLTDFNYITFLASQHCLFQIVCYLAIFEILWIMYLTPTTNKLPGLNCWQLFIRWIRLGWQLYIWARNSCNQRVLTLLISFQLHRFAKCCTSSPAMKYCWLQAIKPARPYWFHQLFIASILNIWDNAHPTRNPSLNSRHCCRRIGKDI